MRNIPALAPAKICRRHGALIVGTSRRTTSRFSRLQEGHARELPARRGLHVADEAKSHAAALILNKSVDTDTLIAEPSPTSPRASPTADPLLRHHPRRGRLTTAEKAAESEGIHFNIQAFNARNRSNGPAPAFLRRRASTRQTGPLRRDVSLARVNSHQLLH